MTTCCLRKQFNRFGCSLRYRQHVVDSNMKACLMMVAMHGESKFLCS
uniref:Uncharacterized protein n=1 Tax=Rhizophora mucronata TaxID=61149 RepID=A0A2P2KAL4_RHIMU